MAALVVVVAGRYTGSYTGFSASADTGVLEDPGWRLGFVSDHMLVNNTDAYGSQVIETIWRGFSAVTLDFRSLEWKAGPINASNQGTQYAGTGATAFKPGLVGRRGTDIAGGLVLTAVAGIPAASSPATATFIYVVMREGTNSEWLFGCENRVLPISFRVIASDAGAGVAQYWTAT